MRICHLSDIHLGYRKYTRLTKNGVNQREADVSIAFRETIDRVLKIKPDLVLIAGDLFHSVRPSNAVVTFCFRELRRLSQGIDAPIVVVAGNHETPKRVDTGCILRLFTEIPKVHIADTKAERFNFPELQTSVYAIPHAALSHIDQIDVRADDTFKTNILLTHGQIEEKWMSEFGGVTVDYDKLKPFEWDYIALGHVHVPRQVGNNGWYCGAVEHTSSNIWAEANENKGFIEVVLPEKKVTLHSLTSPREVITLDSINGFEKEPDELLELMEQSFAQVSGGMDGKIIRLEVTHVPSSVYRQLNHKAIRQFRTQALHLQLEIRPPQDVRLGGGDTAIRRGSLEEELKHFVAGHKTITDSRRDDIHSAIEQYLNRLSEEYEAN